MQRTKTTAAMATLFAAAALSASASEFRIQLPVEARLGQVTLAPGQYTIHSDAGSSAIRVSGSGKTATVLASSIENTAGRQASSIKFDGEGGTPAIREIRSATTGKVYSFATNRGQHTVAGGQGQGR